MRAILVLPYCTSSWGSCTVMGFVVTVWLGWDFTWMVEFVGQ